MKNEKIQMLRGIAICAVVIIHTYTPNLYGVFIRAIVNFAVSMFLFLSGYLTKIDGTNWHETFLKRIKRVVIPYLFWSVLWVILSRNYDNLFFKLLTGGVIVPYYYVFIYVQFVIVTPVIIKLINSKYNWAGWFIQPFFIIILKYIGLESSIHFSVFTTWFSPYYLGLMLGNNIYKNRYSCRTLSFMWVITLCISILEGVFWYRMGNYELGTTQLKLSNTLYVIVCLLIADRLINNMKTPRNYIYKLLVKLGDYSFGIYLSHIFVRTFLYKISVYEYLFFPLNFLLVLGIPTALIYLLRKIINERYGKFIGIY